MGADVLFFSDDVPGIAGVVGFGEADDVADVLGTGDVFLGLLPLDGNSSVRDFSHIQVLGDGCRGKDVFLLLQRGGGHAFIDAGILGAVASFVKGHHIEGVQRTGLQFGKGELADILRFTGDVPGIGWVLSLGEAHDVANILDGGLVVLDLIHLMERLLSVISVTSRFLDSAVGERMS